MHNSEREPGKHVIFLGAGASASSGYPLARDLRLQTSTWSHLQAELDRVMPNPASGQVTQIKENIRSGMKAIFDSHFTSPAIAMFRNGCFASLDEFCKLKRQIGDTSDIQTMKRLTYLALGLNDPECNFTASDYYPFIQKLFCSDLTSLRSDVIIFSFNYDVYLEFLLLRAWETRTNTILEPRRRNQVTGGFSDPTDHEWLRNDAERFRIVKLHGSVEVLDDYRISSFAKAPTERLNNLIQLATRHAITANIYNPPIFFPWELHEAKKPENEAIENPGIASMMVEVFKTARNQLSKAKKISFIGLSMNPLLDETFTKLFYDTPATRIVVTTDLPQGKAQKSEDLPPTHPGQRVDFLIRNARAKSVMKTKIDSFRLVDRSPQPSEMRIVPKFADFIQEEMDPVYD